MAQQNAMTIKGNADSVQINDMNLPSGALFKNRALLRNVRCWHKFVVSNTENLSRNEVLKTILDHVHPLDLIPVFFAKDPNTSHSYFLARNCESAIEKLCKDNLVVNHPYNKDTNTNKFKPFKLFIILNFANTNDVKIDVQKNVLSVLSKRFDSTTKTLNLERFHEDIELSEFCPLSQPKIMYFVLHIAKNLTPEEIILSYNGIKLLNPLDVLIGLKLRCIDLSNNELSSLNDLSSLKHFHLKELNLTGNALCDCGEELYVSKVRLLCPTVEVLDGVPISLDKFPTTKKYFFCDYEDGVDLVNQFLEHFFTVYDSSDRKALAGLYHFSAMFSLTCVYLSGQLSSGSAFLKLYRNISRNLKKAADLSKALECLFRGRESIMDVFSNKLPQTEHDPYSFTADLIYKTDKCAIIVVTGVFHEKPTSLLDKERFLGFTRTFVLEIFHSKCVITNDQLHVYNGLTYQERNSFLVALESNRGLNKELLPKPHNPSDYEDLIVTLSHITNLKLDWSRKCLEECSYDLKASLELFVDLYKASKIPRNGFIEGDGGYRGPEQPLNDKRKKPGKEAKKRQRKRRRHQRKKGPKVEKTVDHGVTNFENKESHSLQPVFPILNSKINVTSNVLIKKGETYTPAPMNTNMIQSVSSIMLNDGTQGSTEIYTSTEPPRPSRKKSIYNVNNVRIL